MKVPMSLEVLPAPTPRSSGHTLSSLCHAEFFTSNHISCYDLLLLSGFGVVDHPEKMADPQGRASSTASAFLQHAMHQPCHPTQHPAYQQDRLGESCSAIPQMRA